MATRIRLPELLKAANRQASEAIEDCETLLERSAFMLRKSNQDNEPERKD